MRALPVLALITFRPEYEAPWTRLAHVTSIALDRLPQRSIRALTAPASAPQAAPGLIQS
ncbi:MAG: hypothetical protein JO139_15525 [Alphaproteobacteria bacterium]|nr:hypothetical protein [Alphaproteobacteria bacterium]